MSNNIDTLENWLPPHCAKRTAQKGCGLHFRFPVTHVISEDGVSAPRRRTRGHPPPTRGFSLWGSQSYLATPNTVNRMVSVCIFRKKCTNRTTPDSIFVYFQSDYRNGLSLHTRIHYTIIHACLDTLFYVCTKTI